MPLWAVHLSDGVLQPNWQLYGFALAALLFLVGAWRMPEEDIPRTALLGAVFFVASSIHVKLGPSSVHLLLNGLLGVTLGCRAALAIPVGLFLQAALLGHGGFGTLGVNSCMMVLPALAVAGLFRLLHGRRSAPLIGASILLGSLSLVFSVGLLATNQRGLSLVGLSLSSAPGATAVDLDLNAAAHLLIHPLTLIGIALVTGVGVWLGRRQSVAPEFALGLLLGLVGVLLTLLLQAIVLVCSGEAQWHKLGVLLFVVHLPIAVLEGTVLGFSIAFLARVKPELLGLAEPAVTTGEPACSHVPLS